MDHKRIHLEKPVSVRSPEEEQPKIAVDEEPVDEKTDLKNPMVYGILLEMKTRMKRPRRRLHKRNQFFMRKNQRSMMITNLFTIPNYQRTIYKNYQDMNLLPITVYR